MSSKENLKRVNNTLKKHNSQLRQQLAFYQNAAVKNNDRYPSVKDITSSNENSSKNIARLKYIANSFSWFFIISGVITVIFCFINNYAKSLSATVCLWFYFVVTIIFFIQMLLTILILKKIK